MVCRPMGGIVIDLGLLGSSSQLGVHALLVLCRSMAASRDAFVLFVSSGVAAFWPGPHGIDTTGTDIS